MNARPLDTPARCRCCQRIRIGVIAPYVRERCVAGLQLDASCPHHLSTPDSLPMRAVVVRVQEENRA